MFLQSHVFKLHACGANFHVSGLTQWLATDLKELFRPLAVTEPDVFEDLHDVREVTEEDGKIEVDCQFCNKKYLFYREDCDKLFNKDGKRKTT